MALPTTDKKWIFKKLTYVGWDGVRYGDQIIDNARSFWFTFKQGITTATGWTDQDGYSVTNTNPWTVSASSDGTTGDLTDRWLSTDNINYNSWVVLRQPSINPLFEILIQAAVNGNYATSTCSVSHSAGFDLTYLPSTSLPTSTDLVYPFGDSSPHNIWGNITAGFVMYFCMSTDGECTRVFFWSNNTLRGFWAFEKPKNPVPQWTNPSICYWWHQDSNLWATLCSEMTDNARVNCRINNQTGWMYYTTEFYIDGAISQKQVIRNEITNEWQMQPIGLCCTTTGISGRHGEVYDLWFVPTVIYSGVTFPESSTRRDFLVLSNVAIPWNQSYMITTC